MVDRVDAERLIQPPGTATRTPGVGGAGLGQQEISVKDPAGFIGPVAADPLGSRRRGQPWVVVPAGSVKFVNGKFALPNQVLPPFSR
jgi:hypothetical protein